MCHISVCQDTGEENCKLAWRQGGLPSCLCNYHMNIVRAEDALVAGT